MENGKVVVTVTYQAMTMILILIFLIVLMIGLLGTAEFAPDFFGLAHGDMPSFGFFDILGTIFSGLD